MTLEYFLLEFREYLCASLINSASHYTLKKMYSYFASITRLTSAIVMQQDTYT